MGLAKGIGGLIRGAGTVLEAVGAGPVVSGAAKLTAGIGTTAFKTFSVGADKFINDGIHKGGFKKAGSILKENAKKVGIAAGKEAVLQANTVSNVGLGAKKLFVRNAKPTVVNKTTKEIISKGEESLLGVKATPLLVGALAVGSLGKGTVEAGKQYVNGRVGYNEGTIYGNAPTFNGQKFGSFSSHAYANNGGATGDLVLALHNQRNGGIY